MARDHEVPHEPAPLSARAPRPECGATARRSTTRGRGRRRGRCRASAARVHTNGFIKKPDARVRLDREHHLFTVLRERAHALREARPPQRAVQEGVHAVVEGALDVATADAVARAERDRADRETGLAERARRIEAREASPRLKPAALLSSNLRDMISARYVHTNVIARDWRTLARFYEEVFGCVVVPPERDLSGEWLERGTGVRGARLRGVHLRLPGHGDAGPTIEIFSYDDVAPQSHPVANRAGYGHIAFLVERRRARDRRSGRARRKARRNRLARDPRRRSRVRLRARSRGQPDRAPALALIDSGHGALALPFVQPSCAR